ncbi:uroporphyrinogen-III synthase [Halocalculus aciditolerans]|uniref:Uroporphyrinogen-III synthase n=1 Tax=Halocalculus aciditolerans TaxID=1383812 RepID=A0A830F746_9EURY|nr:uroporphyrinogen-III synthase [Halocalculus aciditolerans]GGL47422.1 uroporphyrinogen-III synthase [Halocalculus aciditolerans]
MRVAVFRPDDGRLDAAVHHLDERGVEAVPDPMLEVVETDATPRTDADFVVFTSKTGARLAADAGWEAGSATVCAIGDSTAGALEAEDYAVDVVPETFSSTGLVEELADDVDGARVEVARSDHGSQILLDGLEAAGAYVHETVLYRLRRPPEAGESTELAATGGLDAALFTSSLTVEHFLDAASERGIYEDAVAGLNTCVVACIGEPTRETAESHGVDVDVVPDEASFTALVDAALAALK